MALWGRARQEFFQLRESLDIAIEVAAQASQGIAMQAGGESSTSRVAVDLIAEGTPVVYGPGLWFDVARRRAVAALFAPRRLVGSIAQPLSLSPLGAVLDLDGMGRAADVLVVGLQSPLMRFGRSSWKFGADAVYFDSSQAVGRLGMSVWTKSGRPAFTTAGHNSLDYPTRVRDASGVPIGSVRRSISLQRSPAGAPSADAALVELSASQYSGGSGEQISVAKLGQEVQFSSIDGPRTSFVLGVMPAMLFRVDMPPWGEVFITSQMFSRPGDSGGAVRANDGSSVGHVVGGYEPAYTVVQDADYVLRALQARAR